MNKQKLKKLKQQGKLRDSLEIWVDRHNHKLELVRTIAGLVGVMLSSLILLKVFKVF
jgi:hypothetical protein